MSNPPLDIYALLGLDEAASNEDVKRAYKKMARKLHPDVSSGTEKAMSELNSAYAYYQAWYAEKLLDEADPVFFTSTVAPPKAATAPPTAATAAKATPAPPTSPPRTVPTPPRFQTPPPHTTPAPAQTRTAPTTSTPKTPVPTSSRPTHTRSHRRRNVIRIGAVAGIIVIALMAWNNLSSTDGGQAIAVNVSTQPQPSPSPDLATVIAADQTTIDGQIATLSLNCIDIPYCPVFDGEANNIPVFVDGLDQNMLHTLQDWGYRDIWSDNHGKSLSSFDPRLPDRFTFAASVRTNANTIPTGLAYLDQGVQANIGLSNGDSAGDVWPGGKPWKITWTLFDSSGAIARQLTYTAQTLPGGSFADYLSSQDCSLQPLSRACKLNALVGTTAEFRAYTAPPIKNEIPMPRATTGS